MEGSPDSDSSPVFKQRASDAHTEAETEHAEDEIIEVTPTKKVTQEKQQKPLPKIILCTAQTKYRVVKKACRKLDYRLDPDENLDWDLYWADTQINQAKIKTLLPYQRINHYPNMQALAHKHQLSKNLMKMQKVFQNEYNFFPKTWILPSDASDLKAQFNLKKSKTFIVKPVANCQGRGIYLTRDYERIDQRAGEQYVVQRYMHKPYLIDGLKFDMRIYVFVYGVDPLRVFVFREGLARFATQEYNCPGKGNMDNLFMHLTNYAINRNADNFEANEGGEDNGGHKRTVNSVLKYIEQKEGVPAEQIWAEIDDIAVKTLISAAPQLQHAYRAAQPDDMENSVCFEVLGIDIFIDEKIKPWLIEVNSLASFATDAGLDKQVKYDLLYETFRILDLTPEKKKRLKKERQERANKRQQSRDPTIDKQQKMMRRDALKRQLQKDRDKHDLALCEKYKRVYPSDNPLRQQVYTQMMDQAKHIYSLGGGKRSFGNVNLPTNLPSASLPKSAEKPFTIKAPAPKTDVLQKSKAINLEKVDMDTESQKSQPDRIHKIKQYQAIPNPNNPYGGYQRFSKQNQHRKLLTYDNVISNDDFAFNETPSPDTVSIPLTKYLQSEKINQTHQRVSEEVFLNDQDRKSERNLQKSQKASGHKKECLAKTIQKQFPLIKLEASLLVNGCVEQCPVHGNYVNTRTVSDQKTVNKSPLKISRRQSAVLNERRDNSKVSKNRETRQTSLQLSQGNQSQYSSPVKHSQNKSSPPHIQETIQMDDFDRMYQHANTMGNRLAQQQKMVVGLLPSTSGTYQTPQRHKLTGSSSKIAEISTNMSNIPIQIGSRIPNQVFGFQNDNHLQQITIPQNASFKQTFPYQVNFYNKITVQNQGKMTTLAHGNQARYIQPRMHQYIIVGNKKVNSPSDKTTRAIRLSQEPQVSQTR